MSNTTTQALEDGYYHLQRELTTVIAQRDAAHAALQKAMQRNAHLEAENIRLNLAIRDVMERYVQPTKPHPGPDQGNLGGAGSAE
jgi:predicted  nucleic acid-binding Zn-ribbon protein